MERRVDKLRPSTMPWKQMVRLDKPTQEEWFDMWADELIEAGYITAIVSHPDVPTFRLFPGYDKPYGKKKNVVMHPVDYTPDRIIKWSKKSLGVFCTSFDGDNKDWDSCYFKAHYEPKGKFYYNIIEVKGPTGNQVAYGTKFVFTQKWLWANTQQFVQKVMLYPARLFKQEKSLLPYLWAMTFTPKRFYYSDKLSTNRNKPVPLRAAPNKKGVPLYTMRTLEEFLAEKASTE